MRARHQPKLGTPAIAGFWVIVVCAACSGSDRRVDPASQPDAGPADDVDAAVEPGATPDAEVDTGATADAELRDAATEDPPAAPSPMLETVAPSEVTAGDTFRVECRLVDANGAPVNAGAGPTPVPSFEPAEAVRATDEGTYRALQAGHVRVRCTQPGALEDDTPATIEIRPGPVAKVVTLLEPAAVSAGSDVHVRCSAVDAEGNATSDASITRAITPADDRNTIEGDTLHVKRAGSYEVACQHPRAKVESAALTVSAGAPAKLVLATEPQRLEYAPGETVTIASTVFDAFDNRVPDAAVTLEADGGAEAVGASGFRFEAGKHIVRGSHRDVKAELVIFVDGGPPRITCDEPLDGAQVVTAEDHVTLRGRVADGSGIASVQIAGESVPVHDGAFEYRMPTTFGVNAVQIVAIDGAGVYAYQLCAFTAAPDWVSDPIDAALTVQLSAAAVDDGDRDDPVSSVADLAQSALESSALRDAVHAKLSERPELKPNQCDESILGACVLRSEVRYVDLAIDGRPSLSLSLVDGGIAADLTLRDVRLRARVRGQVAGIEYDSLGWVTLQSLRLRAAFDVELSAGRPHAALRRNSLSTQVSGVDTDFGNVDGAIIDLLADLFNGTLRSELTSAIQGVASDQLAGAVSDVLGGLDVADLGSTLSVARLGGGSDIDLELGFSLQSLTITPERMTLGIASTVGGELERPAPALGVPARDLLSEVRSADEPFAVSVHEAFASQLVLGMWRGGMFEANLDGREIADLPKGLGGRVAVEMPPIIELIGDRLRLSAGSIALDVKYPPLFGNEPVAARALLRLSAALRIEQGKLALGDIRIDEVRLASSRPDLMGLQSESTQAMLIPALQLLLAPALEQIALSVPIPTLAVPSVLSGTTESPDARLGLASPDLSFDSPRAVIAGTPALQ